MLIAIIAVVVVLVLLIVYAVSVNNHAKSYLIGIDEARADIEVYLVKRYDVLTESCKVVKSFAGHENEVFEKLSKIREHMTASEINDVAQQQDRVHTQLFALGEAYPELRSSEAFVKLQSQISDENEHFAASKRAYNSNVSIYNKYIVKFPTNIFAGIFGCTREEFLKDSSAHEKGNFTLNI